MMSSMEVGGERRSHTKFGDDVTTTSSDTACKSWQPISKGIHFGLLIRCTTVNNSIKSPGKQNLFQTNSEIVICRMFVQWIMVPNFELQIAYVDTIVAIRNPERHVRKASHRGSKQTQRSCSQSLFTYASRHVQTLILAELPRRNLSYNCLLALHI